MLKSLDALYQRNVKKSEKSAKIAITEGKNLHIDQTNFNEIFRKGVAYIILKVIKKQGFAFSVYETHFRKNSNY